MSADGGCIMVVVVDWRLFINQDPLVLGGRPVFSGTRIPVDLVLRKLADGVETDVILQDYPELTEESVRDTRLISRSTPDRWSLRRDPSEIPPRRERRGPYAEPSERRWRAVSERRILLTRDLDFGEIVFQLGIRCPVILFRFAGQDFASRARAIDGLMAARGDDLGTSFVVLDERSARLRPL